MPRPLKLFKWSNPRRMDCAPAPNGSRETLDFVAATSKVAAKTCLEESSKFARIPISEITTADENGPGRVALASPGVVFWRPIDGHKDSLKRAANQSPSSAPI